MKRGGDDYGVVCERWVGSDIYFICWVVGSDDGGERGVSWEGGGGGLERR